MKNVSLTDEELSCVLEAMTYYIFICSNKAETFDLARDIFQAACESGVSVDAYSLGDWWKHYYSRKKSLCISAHNKMVNWGKR